MVERASSAAGVDIRRDYALNSGRLSASVARSPMSSHKHCGNVVVMDAQP